MLTYPQISPIAVQIGSIKIHWYGLMYVAGIILGWILLLHRAKHSQGKWNSTLVGDLTFYFTLGMLVGGRVGYMIFYDLPQLISHPFSLLKVWQGGMSFHGGLLGVVVAMWLFGRRFHKHFGDISDFLVPVVPIGLAAGRIGNFINGELWGKVTDMPWAMIFPYAGPYPRHPSQLYEFILEGVVLFIILWIYSAKPRPRLAVSGLFAVCYGSFRIVIEFFRQPDAQYGYLAWGWLTMGQLLSFPLVLVGVILLWFAHHNSSKIKQPVMKDKSMNF